MLQQILRDLHVDPEILAELDEQQKQTLFCKMREEQVRRWKSWDQKLSIKPQFPQNTPNSRKTVTFMQGSDGEPWVWVMGEHANDRSIEEILKEEAMEKARTLAERETEELRKQVQATLSDYIDMSPNIKDLQDEDIYCSVDELRDRKLNKPKKANNYSLNPYQSKNKYNLMDSRDVLQEINLNKVSQKVALWEKRLTEERACEILKSIQKKQMEVAKEAEEAEQKQEDLWREQERKAKQAELQIREIARRAREEHRQACGFEIECAYNNVNTGVPPGKRAVLEWYKNNERGRNAGLNALKEFEPWFHGLITRSEAEARLQDQTDGTFLVRLSERVWGYAISYRAKTKCKHYLVSANKKYSFLGNNQMEHQTLGELVKYHMEYPLSGGEKLVRGCPRRDAAPVLDVI